MATIRRTGDTFVIRSSLPLQTIKEDHPDFDSWCYLHRVKLQHAPGSTNGTTISFDIGMVDDNIAYLFRAVCEIEKDAKGE